MTELVLKGDISRKKLDSIVDFIKSCDIEVEVKQILAPKTEEATLFATSFGMWEEQNIDIKAIRRKARERRTKNYNNDTL